MDKESWRSVVDFPIYEVSDLGRVRNKETGHILNPGLGGVGYLTVALYKDKKATTKNVHQLVAEAFIETPRPGMTINHKDGNKTNNVVSNLEVVTRRENLLHAYDMGLNQHKKRVRIVETGEVFDSQIDCAKAINGHGSNIAHCLSGKLKSHKGLHFERVADKPCRETFLRDYQRDAVSRMRDGCILNGGVGSGKSRTGLYYYFSQYGGSKMYNDDYSPMKNPPDLYIITTARKRDSLDWEAEMGPFLLTTNREIAKYNHNVVVDSWNNIGKYADVKDSFFILDEQRVVGSGAWVKSFLKIAKSNRWILLSATAGDTWLDFVPVFLANGFYKNKSEFIREHVVYSRFSKFPKVDRYLSTGKLLRLKNQILVDMEFERKTVRHNNDIFVNYDISLYKNVMKTRWDPYNNKPIKNASQLCYILRKIVNSDDSRMVALLEILEKTPKAIIFYNFDYEKDLLKETLSCYRDVELAEWNGHVHQEVPTSDKWVYLVQYTAGSEAWNCIKTDTIIFFSQNYSYKIVEQASGRIDRLNTPFRDLYYYHLRSRSGIDLAITRALNTKKRFNAKKFTKWDERKDLE